MFDDLRLAARGMLRARGLTAAAVLCLALGIGGTTIVYSVTSALVLHPVPATDPAGLVMVGEVPPARPGPDDADMAPANYVDLSTRNRSFSELAAFTNLDANLTGIDEPERVAGFRVTPSYFHLLGVRPTMGRAFNDEDARYTDSPDVIIISDGLWHRRFGADAGVVGRVVRINDVPRTIVGVMPAGFVFPPGAELWSPLSLAGDFGRERDGRFLRGVLARLKPGDFTGACACRRPRHHATTATRVSSGRRQVGHARRRRGRVLRTASAAVHARPARRGRARPAHRVRERRQLAPRSRHDAHARSRRPRRARRVARTYRASAARRIAAARASGRAARNPARRLGHRGGARHAPRRTGETQSRMDAHGAERGSARRHRRRLVCHRDARRASARVRRQRRRSAASAERRWTRRFGGPLRATAFADCSLPARWRSRSRCSPARS